MGFNIAFQWRIYTCLEVYTSKAGVGMLGEVREHINKTGIVWRWRKSQVYDVTGLFTSLSRTGFCTLSSDFMLKYCVLSVEMLKDKWQPVTTVFLKMVTPRHKLIEKDWPRHCGYITACNISFHMINYTHMDIVSQPIPHTYTCTLHFCISCEMTSFTVLSCKTFLIPNPPQSQAWVAAELLLFLQPFLHVC